MYCRPRITKNKRAFEGGRDVGDKRHVVDSDSKRECRKGEKSKTQRGREKRKKRKHTTTGDAILDERGGCLNPSESLPDNRVWWYEKSGVGREWVYAWSSCRTYR